MAKEEYRKTILPSKLLKAWLDADQLYTLIKFCLDESMVSDVMLASEQLVAVDSLPERSFSIRALVLMRNGLHEQAEKLLQEFLNKQAEHFTDLSKAVVFTNLAIVQNDKGATKEASETLLKALSYEPNHLPALEVWLKIHGDVNQHPERVISALQKLKLPKPSWLVSFLIARQLLILGKKGEAMKIYGEELKRNDTTPRAKYHPNSLLMASGDLGAMGHSNEVVDLLLPIYDVKQHGIWNGINLLQASLSCQRLQEVIHLLGPLRELLQVEQTQLSENEIDELMTILETVTNESNKSQKKGK